MTKCTNNGPNLATLQALARLIVAHRAYGSGEIQFAGEVLAGAWDHTNRSDIAEVYRVLCVRPSTVGDWLNSITWGA